MSSTGTSTPISVPASTKINGIVMGGQQPVAGVTLQLYTVGTTGYGSSATPLGASFQTTAAGNFNLPSYICPSGSALTYLVGTGGQPIAATSTAAAVTNPNLAMMVGLGACSTVGSSFIDLNEVTTVATVWSLSPFMTAITNVGAPATNALGIQNAFAAINKVADTTNGQVSGPLLPTNAILPIAEIDTLADVLEQCINSGGSDGVVSDGQTTGNGCDKLFFLTNNSTDTITAALYIAKHPALNTAKLNILRSASPVFQPAIDSNQPPSDWTIAITYSGGGLSSPRGVAADQNGNVWVANSGNSSVSKFNSNGAAISGATGFTAGFISAPYSLAVDQIGNIWVANSGNGSITRLDSTGSAGTVYNGNGLSNPRGIAIDSLGNVFVSNAGSNVFSGFNSAGNALPGSPYASSSLNAPVAIAVSAH